MDSKCLARTNAWGFTGRETLAGPFDSYIVCCARDKVAQVSAAERRIEVVEAEWLRCDDNGLRRLQVME